MDITPDRRAEGGDTVDDLISRAAAIECAIDAVDDWDGGWNPTRETVIRRYFEELPAVDAAPVVHARWKSVKAGASNNYPFWDSKCSECGYTTAMTQTGWLYCPHCGAKMDGERRDENAAD